MTIAGTVYNNGGENRTAGYMPVFGEKKPADSSSFKDMATQKDAANKDGEKSAPSGIFSLFKTAFDIINPLQHIPVVSAIYRHFTGDEPTPIARLAGDMLYGGPIGVAVGAADIALKKTTGKDMGETAFAMVGIKPSTPVPDSGTMIASNIAPAQDSRPSTKADGWNGTGTFTTPTLSPVSASKDGSARMAAATTLLQQDAPKGAGHTPALSGPILGGKPAVKITPEHYFATHETQGPTTTMNDPTSQKMIAQKMMDALDKYGAMKKSGMMPALSGTY